MKHQRNANSARKPSPKGRRNQRRSVTERRRLLARYERSGLSQKAFCLRHGVALSTLQYWRRRARDTDQEPTPSFVEIPQVTGIAGVRSVEVAVRRPRPHPHKAGNGSRRKNLTPVGQERAGNLAIDRE